MPLMPSLGPLPPSRPWLKALVASAVVGVLAGGLYQWRNRPQVPAEPLAAATAAPLPPPEPAPAPPAAPDPAVALAKAGLRRAQVTLNGPIETALVDATDPSTGPALAQVVTRALVWWVQVPGEILRGDRLEVLFEDRAGQEPLLHAVRFVSQKTGKTHQAYRFAAPGLPFARHYQPTGEELEMRLDPSPLADFEQVTSLLRDGRKHKGMDFKAPVGTPVLATFNGTITRRNWNFRGNGNSLEVTEASGRRKALFLHLAELPATAKVGARVKTGQVIAQSGNTGRSFAPHLHYQLMGGSDRVLDPLEEHRAVRRGLAPEHRALLDAEVTRLSALLGP